MHDRVFNFHSPATFNFLKHEQSIKLVSPLQTMSSCLVVLLFSLLGSCSFFCHENQCFEQQ